MRAKRLLLLRHAKSSWSQPMLPDIDRPLNGRGRLAAAAVGAFLSESGLVPDHAVVSTSRRTRETWKRACREIPSPPPAVYTEALYHAGPAEMLQLIRRSPVDAQSVLLLGHNPGMGTLAQLLAGGGGFMSSGSRFLKFPTAGLAVFSVASPDWESFRGEHATMVRFVDARSLQD